MIRHEKVSTYCIVDKSKLCVNIANVNIYIYN